MARGTNDLPTETVTLSTTPQVVMYLHALVSTGLYGKNVAEAAEQLLTQTIRAHMGEELVVQPLREALAKTLKAGNIAVPKRSRRPRERA